MYTSIVDYKELVIKLNRSNDLDDITEFVSQYDEIKEGIDMHVVSDLLSQLKITSHIDFSELRPIPYLLGKNNIRAMVSYLKFYRDKHSYTSDEISRLKEFLLSNMDASICYSLILMIQ